LLLSFASVPGWNSSINWSESSAIEMMVACGTRLLKVIFGRWWLVVGGSAYLDIPFLVLIVGL
jgi:hypothetical protein